MNEDLNIQMANRTTAVRAPRAWAVSGRWGRRVPTLDAMLGFALLRDRRVHRAQKLHALLMGGGIVAGAIALTVVAATLVGIPGSALNVVADGLGLASGTLLIGSLLVMRLAPVDVVSRVRCERYHVIPLRRRSATPATQLRMTDVDPLTALGYAERAIVREYAVIPCRER